MTRPQQGISLGIVVLWALFIALGSSDPASAVTPYRCRVPPVVSSLAKPNIMLLVDFSGSMQFPAYWPMGGYSVASSTPTYNGYRDGSRQVFSTYDPYTNYYGYFDSAAYYKYTGTQEQPYDTFVTISPTGSVAQQSNTYTITHMKIDVINPDGSAEPNGDERYEGYFRYTRQNGGDPAIAVDDCVVIKGLPGQGKFVNGKSFKVKAVGADYFVVDVQPWRDELPEKDDDYVDLTDIKPKPTVMTRVTGNFSEGISGNFLNWASMSRMDNALMALIGGREADKDSDNSFIEAQGCRANVRENTNLNLDVYIRPGDYDSTTSFNTEAYNTGKKFNDKVTFLSVSNHYRGELDSGDNHTLDPGCSSTNAVAEMYHFRVARRTRFKIEMWPDDSDMRTRIKIWNQEPTGSNNPRWEKSGGRGDPTLWWITLDAGEYWMEATTWCDNNHPYGKYTLIMNQDLEIVDGDTSKWESLANPGHNGQVQGTVGALPFARVRIRKPLAERVGVIQNTFDKVRYGFTHYSAYYTGDNGWGVIEIGCENTDMDKLIAALERKRYDSSNDFSTTVPYGGTPTGPAVKEMWDYFRQENHDDGYGTNGNKNFISRGTEKDPYYQKTPSGAIEARPCRQSYVVLLSDGEWNTGNWPYRDPMTTAYKMHTQDLRTESAMAHDQTVNFYTIYSFANDVRGKNSMKEVAMYGGFTDLADDNGNYDTYIKDYPYTANRGDHLPSTSLNTQWPLAGCCKCLSSDDSDCKYKPGTYSDGCKEWAYVLLEQTGDSLQQVGVPKNFFYAADGAEIEKAFLKILAEIESTRAAASAVATVSQEVRGRDVILRGVFQAADTVNTEDMVWYGHLEWYLPYKDPISGETMYLFQEPDWPELCYKSNDDRCLDGAQILRDSISKRQIFTWLDADNDGKVDWSTEKTLFATSNAETLKDLLGYANKSDAEDLIKWVRGEQVSGLRRRFDTDDTAYGRWILGDIVYSTPVIVGVPPLGAVSRNDPDVFPPDAAHKYDPRWYHGYRNSVIKSMFGATETPSGVDEVVKQVVYVGGNDGMLHAFVFGVWDPRTKDGDGNDIQPKWVFERDSSDPFAKYVGDELWSYIPSNLLSNLKVLADPTYGKKGGCVHRTMVDLSPRAWQVWIDHNGTKQWRTVLLGGERGGGDVYFCIDVTDPDNPQLLWEFSMLKDLVRFDGSLWSLSAFNDEDIYKVLKDLPLSWSKPSMGRLYIPSAMFPTGPPRSGVPGIRPKVGDTGLTGKRHVAFVGGAFRYFDNNLDPRPSGIGSADLDLLRFPQFVALDVETGENLFRYVWRKLAHDYSTMFPNRSRKNLAGVWQYRIPYSPTHPLVLDVWNMQDYDEASTPPKPGHRGTDGFTDHIYVGDLTGYLYGIKFNLGQTPSRTNSSPAMATRPGFRLDTWLTKGIDESDSSLESKWSRFRYKAQPITVQPSATIDGEDKDYLRVIFGAGKYDDVVPEGGDDKTDPAKTSLYNLKDEVAVPTITASQPLIPNRDLYVDVNANCGDPAAWRRLKKFDNGCTWNKGTDDSVTGDCCEKNNSDCNDPCWECIYDLELPTTYGDPGERFVSKALIAGGLVFVTSYVPPKDPCTFVGEGYLYIFDYLCKMFPEGFNPVPEEDQSDIIWFGRGPAQDRENFGLRLALGGGVPSEAILDSEGEHVIIQLSTGELKRIKVDLLEKAVTVQGWKEIR